MGLGCLMCLSWTDRVIHSRWILFISARLVHPQMDNMSDRHDSARMQRSCLSLGYMYLTCMCVVRIVMIHANDSSYILTIIWLASQQS
jgi:hypothetical protein